MADTYTRVNWKDSPSTETPLSEANLNKMDKGIEDAHNAIEEIKKSVVSDEQMAVAVENYLTANPIEETDPTVPEWAKQPEKPSYSTSELTNDSGFLTEHQDLSGYAKKNELPTKASDIGAEASGTAVSKVSEHNVATDAHGDIRLLITNLTQMVTSLLDCDDEDLNQTSEIVAYIKSNKTLIEAITTSKVGVSDIIDNLTTSVTNKPLSAKQGVVLKGLIDTLQTELNKIIIPTTLPNPNALTIKKGDATVTYDGSGTVTIEIPTGDGGSIKERIEKASTDTAVTLEPNKLYVFPEMTELDVTLAEITDTSKANEFHFIFQSGTAATTFSIPDTIKVPGSFSIEANKIYEISILENCLCAQSWAVS